MLVHREPEDSYTHKVLWYIPALVLFLYSYRFLHKLIISRKRNPEVMSVPSKAYLRQEPSDEQIATSTSEEKKGRKRQRRKRIQRNNLNTEGDEWLSCPCHTDDYE